MDTRLRLEIDQDVAQILLDDGKVNAMSKAMLDEMGSALDAAEGKTDIVVLRGRENIFSAGFDLGTFARGAKESLEMVSAGAELIQRLLAYPAPIVTVCTGHAYPMGAFLMLASDLRIGVRGPWRIGMNEVAIGITPPKFAIELARHRLTPMGYRSIPVATMFDPEEALRLGYLDRLCDVGSLEDVLEEEIDRLRALDRPSFIATKQRTNAMVASAIADAFSDEIEAA